MKKLTAKNLVDFRKKSDRGKRTFVENIKANKAPIPTEGGGDYWTASLSAVCKAYKQDDLNLVNEKITEVIAKLNGTNHTRSKTMFKRNIDILQKYLRMDLKQLSPVEKLSFPKKSTGSSVLTIRGLQVEVDAKRCYAYTFGKKDEESIGAIWFIAQVDGYRIEEVGMFCEMLYRFLKLNYSKQYQLSSKFCIVVDMVGGHVVNYAQVEDGTIQQILNPTLDAINKLI